jgi:hypothetical protein
MHWHLTQDRCAVNLVLGSACGRTVRSSTVRGGGDTAMWYRLSIGLSRMSDCNSQDCEGSSVIKSG